MRSLILLSVILVAGCTANRPDNYGYTPPTYQTNRYATGNEVISGGAVNQGAQLPPTAPAVGAETDHDRTLMEQIRQTMNSGPMAAYASNVSVSAQQGTVTLTGTVPSDQQRQVVDNIVRSTPGVLSVNDQLQVAANPPTYPAPTGGAPVPPAAVVPAPGTTTASGDIFSLHVQGLNDTDRNLAQRILEGLRTDTQLASLLPTVNINVSSGRVILQGIVQNQQQKQTIASVVERAAGTSNVDDQLRVVSP